MPGFLHVPSHCEIASVIERQPAGNSEQDRSVKIARIFDQDAETFAVEYDNTLGKKNTMRLEATTYEGAIREAKAFLGISAENTDADGIEWEVG